MDDILSLIAEDTLATSNLAIGQKVRVRGIANAVAVIRHIGPIHSAPGEYVGIELNKPVGKNDGTIDNVTYFLSKPKHGLFVRPGDVEVIESAAPAPHPSNAAPQVSNLNAKGLKGSMWARSTQAQRLASRSAESSPEAGAGAIASRSGPGRPGGRADGHPDASPPVPSRWAHASPPAPMGHLPAGRPVGDDNGSREASVSPSSDLSSLLLRLEETPARVRTLQSFLTATERQVAGGQPLTRHYAADSNDVTDGLEVGARAIAAGAGRGLQAQPQLPPSHPIAADKRRPSIASSVGSAGGASVGGRSIGGRSIGGASAGRPASAIGSAADLADTRSSGQLQRQAQREASVGRQVAPPSSAAASGSRGAAPPVAPQRGPSAVAGRGGSRPPTAQGRAQAKGQLNKTPARSLIAKRGTSSSAAGSDTPLSSAASGLDDSIASAVSAGQASAASGAQAAGSPGRGNGAGATAKVPSNRAGITYGGAVVRKPKAGQEAGGAGAATPASIRAAGGADFSVSAKARAASRGRPGAASGAASRPSTTTVNATSSTGNSVPTAAQPPSAPIPEEGYAARAKARTTHSRAMSAGRGAVAAAPGSLYASPVAATTRLRPSLMSPGQAAAAALVDAQGALARGSGADGRVVRAPGTSALAGALEAGPAATPARAGAGRAGFVSPGRGSRPVAGNANGQGRGTTAAGSSAFTSSLDDIASGPNMFLSPTLPAAAGGQAGQQGGARRGGALAVADLTSPGFAATRPVHYASQAVGGTSAPPDATTGLSGQGPATLSVSAAYAASQATGTSTAPPRHADEDVVTTLLRSRVLGSTKKRRAASTGPGAAAQARSTEAAQAAHHTSVSTDGGAILDSASVASSATFGSGTVMSGSNRPRLVDSPPLPHKAVGSTAGSTASDAGHRTDAGPTVSAAQFLAMRGPAPFGNTTGTAGTAAMLSPSKTAAAAFSAAAAIRASAFPSIVPAVQAGRSTRDGMQQAVTRPGMSQWQALAMGAGESLDVAAGGAGASAVPLARRMLDDVLQAQMEKERARKAQQQSGAKGPEGAAVRPAAQGSSAASSITSSSTGPDGSPDPAQDLMARLRARYGGSSLLEGLKAKAQGQGLYGDGLAVVETGVARDSAMADAGVPSEGGTDLLAVLGLQPQPVQAADARPVVTDVPSVIALSSGNTPPRPMGLSQATAATSSVAAVGFAASGASSRVTGQSGPGPVAASSMVATVRSSLDGRTSSSAGAAGVLSSPGHRPVTVVDYDAVAPTVRSLMQATGALASALAVAGDRLSPARPARQESTSAAQVQVAPAVQVAAQLQPAVPAKQQVQPVAHQPTQQQPVPSRVDSQVDSVVANVLASLTGAAGITSGQPSRAVAARVVEGAQPNTGSGSAVQAPAPGTPAPTAAAAAAAVMTAHDNADAGDAKVAKGPGRRPPPPPAAAVATPAVLGSGRAAGQGQGQGQGQENESRPNSRPPSRAPSPGLVVAADVPPAISSGPAPAVQKPASAPLFQPQPVPTAATAPPPLPGAASLLATAAGAGGPAASSTAASSKTSGSGAMPLAPPLPATPSLTSMSGRSTPVGGVSPSASATSEMGIEMPPLPQSSVVVPQARSQSLAGSAPSAAASSAGVAGLLQAMAPVPAPAAPAVPQPPVPAKASATDAAINATTGASNASSAASTPSASPSPTSKRGGRLTAMVRSYAGVCEQGWNPSNPDKPCQDRIVMVEHPDSDGLLLAVFDGHGEDGHIVAEHFRERVAEALFSHPSYEATVDVADNIPQPPDASEMRALADGPPIGSPTNVKTSVRPAIPESARPRRDVAKALKTVLSAIEKELLARDDVDCSLSGCTGCVAVITGNTVTIANVGDSRAVLFRGVPRDDGRSIGSPAPSHNAAGGAGAGKPDKLIPVPLTIDHKPTLSSETKRILLSGGRVHAIKYDDGGEGPVRVWLRNDDVPGLAMSRSLGDTIGKKAGVSSQPDIYTYTLNPSTDAFLVLASDGLWEFTPGFDVASQIASTKAACDAEWSQYYAAIEARQAAIDEDLPPEQWPPAPESEPAAHLAVALDALAELAGKRWQEREGVIDDISIILATIGAVHA